MGWEGFQVIVVSDLESAFRIYISGWLIAGGAPVKKTEECVTS